LRKVVAKRMSASSWPRARRWRWSANPAPASPPPAAPCCACWRWTRAASSWAARTSARSPAPRSAERGGGCRWCSRTRSRRSTAFMSAGRLVAEPMAIHGVASGAELDDRVESLFRRVGLGPEHHPALPARILRRPAPAAVHRPRARGRAEADRGRRADLGARRLGAGAGAGADAGVAAEPRPRLPVHLARHGGGRGVAHRVARDAPRPDRRDRPARRRARRRPPPLHPRPARRRADPRPDRWRQC
jgi:hypothetical protein